MKFLTIKCLEPVHDPATANRSDMRQEVSVEPSSVPGSRTLSMEPGPWGVLVVGVRSVFIPWTNIRSCLVDPDPETRVTDARKPARA